MNAREAFEVADRIRARYDAPTLGEEAAVHLAALARRLQDQVADLEFQIREQNRRAQGPMHR